MTGRGAPRSEELRTKGDCDGAGDTPDRQLPSVGELRRVGILADLWVHGRPVKQPHADRLDDVVKVVVIEIGVQ